MEKKFKDINRNIKALKRGVMPLSQTFEFDLFKESNWYFAFNEQVVEIDIKNHSPLTSKSDESLINENKKTEHQGHVSDNESIWFGKSVLFVGDSFIQNQENSQDDLLGKMIQAMKLNNTEYSRLAFDKKLEDVDDLSANLKAPNDSTLKLWQAILLEKPKFLVSLGATLTNILLGKREKLSTIHGQFIEITISSGTNSHICQLVPIFHPDFLLINPNMKRTAWIDLQKVMEKLGKI